MGIFDAVEIMFFSLGALTTLGLGAVMYLGFRRLLGPAGLALLGTGVLLGLFTVAWSWSCWIEREPQAAAMGVVFFGIPAAVCIALARRLAPSRQAPAPAK